MGVSVSKGQGSNVIMWTLQPDVTAANIPLNMNNKYQNVGVKQLNVQTVTTISYNGANEHTNLLCLLIHFWLGDWCTQVSHINSINDKRNDENAAKIQISSLESQTQLCLQTRHVTEKEFWIFLGILIAAQIHGKYGSIWDNVEPGGQQTKVNYSAWMRQ